MSAGLVLASIFTLPVSVANASGNGCNEATAATQAVVEGVHVHPGAQEEQRGERGPP